MANYSYTLIGKPVKAPALIPVRHRSSPTCINAPFMVDGELCGVTCVSFGTPHGVVIVDDVECNCVERLGASLTTHRLFPKGANIVFVQALNQRQLKARLWQRVKGESDCTPESVCVAMAAAKMLQKIEREADVFMDGKKFHVKWESSDGNVYLAEPSDFNIAVEESVRT